MHFRCQQGNLTQGMDHHSFTLLARIVTSFFFTKHMTAENCKGFSVATHLTNQHMYTQIYWSFKFGQNVKNWLRETEKKLSTSENFPKRRERILYKCILWSVFHLGRTKRQMNMAIIATLHLSFPSEYCNLLKPDSTQMRTLKSKANYRPGMPQARNWQLSLMRCHHDV